ncbi:glycine-rich domain-containing protein [Saccharopolyspora elongata]|uniref:glycine-rich domain-containing protein n=1 Tax=Saccharopolyspora elongata TaxID=2530387 RepID=UPI001A9FA5A3|nr:hypothetical protein [Saccharopolyspora elongata]
MTDVITDCVHARSLISEDLFARLSRRITIDENVEPESADRIMDQALAFLGACARFPGHNLAPSKPVDIGWHTFILYTREYAEFCERVANRFIHHVPQDAPGAPEHSKAPASVRVGTVGSIRCAGYLVDEELWIASCGARSPHRPVGRHNFEEVRVSRHLLRAQCCGDGVEQLYRFPRESWLLPPAGHGEGMLAAMREALLLPWHGNSTSVGEPGEVTMRDWAQPG